jgi:hypothetical protein
MVINYFIDPMIFVRYHVNHGGSRAVGQREGNAGPEGEE